MSRLGAEFTWLGHSAFHVQCEDGGPAIVIDPWLDNPRAPANAQSLARAARLVLITHGHSDHIGSAAALLKGSNALLLSTYEVIQEIGTEGVPASQLVGFNKGGAVTRDGVTVTLTTAHHSSSLTGADGRPRDVGDACGMIIELANGTVIYNTGDTCVFGDMALIAEMYRPTVLMLPIGDLFTMGPRQAAKACDLVNPQWIIPQHYGTFPALTGTPDALRSLLSQEMRDRLLTPAPGETIR